MRTRTVAGYVIQATGTLEFEETSKQKKYGPLVYNDVFGYWDVGEFMEQKTTINLKHSNMLLTEYDPNQELIFLKKLNIIPPNSN